LWPGHLNLMDYKPVDFISVRVGPLNFSEKHVNVGKPTKLLSRDYRFIAEMEGVELPPLPIKGHTKNTNYSITL
jgi:hypothetical protein